VTEALILTGSVWFPPTFVESIMGVYTRCAGKLRSLE